MTEHKPPLVLIFVKVIYCRILCADGLIWKASPDALVNVKQGSNITLRWHYEMEENETFLSSEFISKDIKTYDFASRYNGENVYYILKNYKTKFAISGENDVNLTVFRAELGSSNSGYCCTVKSDSNKDRMRVERCTTIYIYDLPRITRHTQQLYCKQGDHVKLQCNARGFPEPRVEWIHRDTKQIIGNSSMTSLNITGKIMEGSYCCEVKNQFGSETACTTIKITEYKPQKTTVVYWVISTTLRIKCNATAFPPPHYFLIRINDEQYNSTNVVNTFRYISTQNNTVSCIPFNKYGQGPMKKIYLPGYVPPRFTRKLITQYNMTDRKIKLVCSATGTPKPNITWTRENTEDVVSTEEHYEVPHVKCANKTLIFYCHASNVMGSIRSKEIQVQVMTQRSCMVSDSNKEIIKKKKKLPLIMGILCGILIAICLTVAVFIYLMQRKGITFQDKQPNEDAYAEPLDTVVPSAEILRPNRSTLLDDGYSNPEELGLTNTKKNQRPKEEEFPYETLIVENNAPCMINI